MDIVRRWYREAPATTILVIINVLVWSVTAIQSRSLMNSLRDSSLSDAWILWGPYVSQDGVSWLRAVGAMFLHLDIGHLTINLFMLALIGREVERYLGTALYTAVYFAGGIGASAAVVWMDYNAPTAGASGALFALMAILVGVFRRRGADLTAPIVLILANVVYTFIASGVSLWGHLGGLIAGLLLLPFVFHRSAAVRWAGVAAGLALGCGLIIAV